MGYETFNDFNSTCQSLLRSAWGHPAARDKGIRALHFAKSCPGLSRVSTAGRAALIAANLVPAGWSSPCWDQPLAHAAERACGALWRAKFRSDQWHPHAEGVSYVPGAYVYALCAAVGVQVVALLLLAILGS